MLTSKTVRVIVENSALQTAKQLSNIVKATAPCTAEIPNIKEAFLHKIEVCLEMQVVKVWHKVSDLVCEFEVCHWYNDSLELVHLKLKKL